jgi:hypothetical protein
VGVERTHEANQDLGGLLGARRLVSLAHEAEAFLQVFDRAGTQGEVKAGRRLVRKDEG